jgi:predicted nucleic acid-binding protein
LTVFVDSNITVYAFGGDHPHRANARTVLDLSRSGRGDLWSDAETLQELMHVYLRREGIERARTAIRVFREALLDRIAVVTGEDVAAAVRLDLPLRVQSRDRVHVAVMQRLGLDTIISSDRGFDLVPGVRRLDPLGFEDWREEVFGQG